MLSRYIAELVGFPGLLEGLFIGAFCLGLILAIGMSFNFPGNKY